VRGEEAPHLLHAPLRPRGRGHRPGVDRQRPHPPPHPGGPHRPRRRGGDPPALRQDRRTAEAGGPRPLRRLHRRRRGHLGPRLAQGLTPPAGPREPFRNRRRRRRTGTGAPVPASPGRRRGRALSAAGLGPAGSPVHTPVPLCRSRAPGGGANARPDPGRGAGAALCPPGPRGAERRRPRETAGPRTPGPTRGAGCPTRAAGWDRPVADSGRTVPTSEDLPMTHPALAGVDGVDWAAYRHAYGPAEDLPALLAAAGSADPGEAGEAVYELCGTVWHQGTIYPATAPAVPFLVALGADRRTRKRGVLVGLVGEISAAAD